MMHPDQQGNQMCSQCILVPQLCPALPAQLPISGEKTMQTFQNTMPQPDFFQQEEQVHNKLIEFL